MSCYVRVWARVSYERLGRPAYAPFQPGLVEELLVHDSTQDLLHSEIRLRQFVKTVHSTREFTPGRQSRPLGCCCSRGSGRGFDTPSQVLYRCSTGHMSEVFRCRGLGVRWVEEDGIELCRRGPWLVTKSLRPGVGGGERHAASQNTSNLEDSQPRACILGCCVGWATAVGKVGREVVDRPRPPLALLLR